MIFRNYKINKLRKYLKINIQNKFKKFKINFIKVWKKLKNKMTKFRVLNKKMKMKKLLNRKKKLLNMSLNNTFI